jgi:chemotaxis protein histidine kinase CheA
MDIVRSNLEKVGGHIEVSTKLGEGTTFSIELPISLSILRCLLVQAGTSIIAVPEAQIRATAVAPCETPTLALSRALEGEVGEDIDCPYAIIVESGGRETALGVDRLIAEQDLVVKPLAKWLVSAEGVLGASILANGRVVLIVDPVLLVESLTPQPGNA